MAFLKAAVERDRGESCGTVRKMTTVMETTFHLRLKVEVNDVFIASIYADW